MKDTTNSLKKSKTKVKKKVEKEEAPKPLDDTGEELGIDGNPKHRFYNEELEVKTKAI